MGADGAVVFAAAGTLGVNAQYGLNPTLGSLFGIVGGDPISIPTPGPVRSGQSARPSASPATATTTVTTIMPTPFHSARPTAPRWSIRAVSTTAVLNVV